MNNKLIAIMSFSILIEGIITYFKEFFVGVTFHFSMFLSIILGIVVAVAYKFDIPEYLNLKLSIPYIGNILTGILLSRSSNYLYDLLKTITAIK